MNNKVLVIDDVENNLILVDEVLQMSGIEAITAISGEEGIRQANVYCPDLILLDIMMPGFDGFQVCSALKKIPLTSEIPIIFLTGINDRLTILKSFAVGGVDYIVKPFDEVELLARVLTHLKIQNQKKHILVQNDELQVRESNFRNLFDKTNDAVIIIDKNGLIIESNQKASRLWGYTSEEFNKLDVLSLLHVDETHVYLNFLKEIFIKGSLLFEANTITKNGTEIPTEVSSSTLMFFGSEVILATFRDLTEKKESEKAIKESELKFRNFFENNTSIMLQVRPEDKKIMNFNNSALNFYGYNEDEFLQKTFYDINTLPREEIDSLMIQIITQKSDFFRFKHRTAEKGIRDVDVSVSQVKTLEGLLLFIIINDVTELVEAEKEIRKLSTAVEQGANTIIITDTKGTIEYVNPKFEELTGYSKEEAIGKNPRILKSGKQDSQFYTHMWNTISAGKIWKGEFHNINKYGKMFWEWATITPIKNEKNEIINYLAVKEDITPKKTAEIQLKESQEREAIILNSLQESVFLIESESCKIVDVNPAGVNLLKLSKEDILSKKCTELLCEEQCFYCFKDTSYFETKITEEKLQLPDKTELRIIRTIIPVFLNGEDHLIETITDITERKEVEKRILATVIQTEEKERERIAQDLHDGLGPLMSTIKLYIQWLTKPNIKADKAEIASKAESTVELAYTSLRNIANNLSPHILKNFGLVSAVKSFIDRVKELNIINFDFSTNLKDRIGILTETIVYRILTESINNTLKHAQADYISISINKDDKFLLINYIDNGIGFDTKKMLRQNSGLGLFNMLNRIKSIGGKIDIMSENGKGVEINIIIEIKDLQ